MKGLCAFVSESECKIRLSVNTRVYCIRNLTVCTLQHVVFTACCKVPLGKLLVSQLRQEIPLFYAGAERGGGRSKRAK